MNILQRLSLRRKLKSSFETSLRAKRSNPAVNASCSGLPRRCAPRNDALTKNIIKLLMFGILTLGVATSARLSALCVLLQLVLVLAWPNGSA